ELVIPLQAPSLRVDCDNAARVQINSRPHVTLEVRPRISNSPINKIEVRIIRAGQPRGSAAFFPGVAWSPCFVPGFTRARNRIEAPQTLAINRRVGVDETSDSVIPARNSDKNLVFNRQRSTGDPVSVVVVRNRDVPEQLAGLGVQREQVRIQRSHVDRVAQYRHTAVVGWRIPYGFYGI